MNIIVSGAIGSGKSTVVRRVMERLGWRQPAGFVTRWIADDRSTLLIGTWEGPFSAWAQRREDPRGEEGPPYAVDPSVLHRFAADHLAHVPEQAPVVLDELGVLELGVAPFTGAVAALFRRAGPLLAVIQERALDRWMQILGRDTMDHLFLLAATPRDPLPEHIAALFRSGALP